MAEKPKFNLQKILVDSTKKLVEEFPEAQQLLSHAAESIMQTHLTPYQAQSIAKALLEKVDFKEDQK